MSFERLAGVRVEPSAGPHGPAEMDELVRLYQPLVESVCRRFAGRGEPVDDLRQVARIGLLKAIERFDPDRGVRFSTYAIPTMTGELKRHFRDKGWMLRVPRRVKEQGLKVSQVAAELEQVLARRPTSLEIAERAELTRDEVEEASMAIAGYGADSLDAAADGGRYAFSDFPDPTGQPYDTIDEWVAVAPVLRMLPERDRRILYFRFVAGLTQAEIACSLGVSQMYVSRRLVSILEGVRCELEPIAVAT